MKLRVLVFRENVWHFESKECLSQDYVMRLVVRHLQSRHLTEEFVQIASGKEGKVTRKLHCCAK